MQTFNPHVLLIGALIGLVFMLPFPYWAALAVVAWIAR